MDETNTQNDAGESMTRPTVSEGLQSAEPISCALSKQADPIAFKQVMNLIRRRRKYFFATVIAYMPIMWVANKISPTFRSMAITFCAWVVILFITALYSALARCPRCGHYFHMNGMSLLYLRRCLHCQQHINAS